MGAVTLSLGRDKVLFLDPYLFFFGGGGVKKYNYPR